MNKIVKLLTIGLIASNTWCAISISSRSMAQDTKPPKTTPTQTTTETKPKKASILDALLSVFKSSENRLITRGDKVCLISPSNIGDSAVYSDRPIFIWARLLPETPESQLSLYSVSFNFNFEQGDQLLWRENLAANAKRSSYQEGSLQPGFTYDWKIVFPDKTHASTFRVMDEASREVIAADLTNIEARLTTSNSDSEDIAIAKADYFANQQLWSDVFQQLYSVTNPSEVLLEKRQEIEQYLCSSSKS